MLAVIAYPNFSPPDEAIIEQSRRENPALGYQLIPPHFTVVFSTTAFTVEALEVHVQEQVASQQQIPFVIRCALPFRDVLSANTYLYLVPDEGFSAIVRLHDRLYTGALAGELRLDIPFVPHITVGYAEDALYVKQAADGLNAQNLAMQGLINALEIVELANQGIQPLSHIRLK